jgi:hypothetical protein
VKGRLPPSSIIIPQRTDWSFLWNPQFLVLFTGNFLQGLGNFVPGIWLPSESVCCFESPTLSANDDHSTAFASDMNLSLTSGTLIVAMMNGRSALLKPIAVFDQDLYLQLLPFLGASRLAVLQTCTTFVVSCLLLCSDRLSPFFSCGGWHPILGCCSFLH